MQTTAVKCQLKGVIAGDKNPSQKYSRTKSG